MRAAFRAGLENQTQLVFAFSCQQGTILAGLPVFDKLFPFENCNNSFQAGIRNIQILSQVRNRNLTSFYLADRYFAEQLENDISNFGVNWAQYGSNRLLVLPCSF